MTSVPGILAIIATFVAVTGVLIQYLNGRSWEARRWTRDARLPKYTEFLMASNSYFAALQERERSEEERGVRLSGDAVQGYQNAMRAALAAIRILGPDTVEQAAQSMNNTLYAWDRDDPVGGREGELLNDYEHFRTVYRGNRTQFVEGAKRALLGR